MKNFKRLLASFATFIMLLAITPIVAHAEWRQGSNGWWYTTGNSYYTGWKLIDKNWYYFYSDGYMAHDITIDGYYLNSSGAWTKSAITSDEAEKIALDKVKSIKYPNVNTKLVITPLFDTYEKYIEGRNGYIVTICEDNSEHTVPTERVFVDKSTREVFDAFNVVFGTGDSKLKELA